MGFSLAEPPPLSPLTWIDEIEKKVPSNQVFDELIPKISIKT
jgi:hypothetical protein